MFRRSSRDAEASEPDPRTEADPLDGDDDTIYEYRRSNFQRAVLFLGILTIMGCLVGVTYIVVFAVQVSGIGTTEVQLSQASDDEPQNWLVVGSDSRDVIAANDPNGAVFTGGGEASAGTGQRSDTIMIVRVDPKGEHLDILSLQRDLWLPIARTSGSERINSAYGFPDGPQRLIDTIRQDLKIDINHYVEINFASFQGIVESVGGIAMYFDHPMRDNNSGLMIPESGCRTLDGYQALAFARARHLQYSDGVKWIDDPSGDLGRISRQQFFMRRMFDKAAAKAAHPITGGKDLLDLIQIAKEHVKLDQDIEVTKVAAMAQRFGQFRGDSIRSYTLPVSPETTAGGAAVLKMDEAGAVPTLNIFRGLPEDDASPDTVTFSIENGSGVNGQGAEVQKAFQAIGYKPSGVKDHGTSLARTQLRYAPAAAKAAAQLSRHLTSGADLVEDATLGSTKIVLITGKDFTTVMRRPREATTDGTTPGTIAAGETAASSTSTTAAGQKSTGSKSSTSTSSTTAPGGGLNNTGTSVVGVVPGQPPEGVTCE